MKTAAILALIPLVAGHGAIIRASSPDGGSGMALGVVTSTPRDGTRRNPFQGDSTRFKGDNADTFGQTVGGGENNLSAGTAAIMAETGDALPQIRPGGSVDMVVHQVNGDGAGPYDCMMNSDGTGSSWQNIQVTTNVPGQGGRNRDGAITDHQLSVAIPNDQTCTGNVAGQANVCLVRCQNPARAGPFGGVIPVQMMQAGAPAAPAAARRALATHLVDEARKLRKRDLASDAAALGMSKADLAQLRKDGEEI